MKREKRIPTILGLILLVGTIYLATEIIGKPQKSSVKASQSCEPINPQVTNKTDKSATISFITNDDCFSSLNVENYSYENQRPKGKIHYFEIDKLEANKNYQFDITSDGKKYSSSNYIFETAQKPTRDIPTSNLAWGKVFTPDNNPATQAIVYLNIPGASPLSALVTSSGHWNISLAVSFNEGLTDWFTTPNNIEEDIIVIAPNYPGTQIVSNSSRNNPVPDIILGQNSFSSSEAVIEPELPAESLIDTDIDLVSAKNLDILNPKTNETVKSLKPDFFGTASPNSKLKIKVESPTPYNDEIEADSVGEWNWSPPKNLTPGEHTITVTDDKNNLVTRKFIVLAAESFQPAFSASESAVVVTNTPTPTLVPTKKITPTDIPVVRPSTTSGIPKTGATYPTFLLLILSFIFISFGLIYYKKS
jgi:hypothetical protein